MKFLKKVLLFINEWFLAFAYITGCSFCLWLCKDMLVVMTWHYFGLLLLGVLFTICVSFVFVCFGVLLIFVLDMIGNKWKAIIKWAKEDKV